MTAPSPPPDRGTTFWRDRWIAVGLCLFAALRLTYFVQVSASLPLLGDEGFYFHHASTVAAVAGALLSGDTAGAAALAHQLVDRGWFLPGMSIVLAPMRAVTASVPSARLYIGAVNAVLLWWGVRRLAGLYGLAAARLAVGIVTVLPAHAAFSFTFWGETVAGHGLLHLLITLARTQRDMAGGARLHPSRLAALAGLIVGLIYVRPGLILLVPATGVWLFLFALPGAPIGAALRRSTFAAAAIVAMVAAGLAPWTYYASSTFGGLFITTTTVNLNIVEVFGGDSWREDLRPGDNAWIFLFEQIQREAAETGSTFATQLQRRRNEAIARLTWPGYAAVVRQNLHAFFLAHSEFLERFGSPDFATRGKAQVQGPFNRAVIAVNDVAWRLALTMAVLLLLAPWRLAGAGWWLGALYRGAFCAVASQPYLSHASGRYYVMLIPLVAASVGVAVITFRTPHATAVSWRPHDTLFRTIEWAMPAAIAALVAAVVTG